MNPFAQFALCSGLIIGTSHYASVYGGKIAHHMKWQAAFIGVLFLAVATSLPEVFTSLAAVMIKEVNLGFGDVIGSLTMNFLILVVLLGAFRPRDLNFDLRGNVKTGIYTMILLAIVAVFLYARSARSIGWSLGPIGIESFLIACIYLWGMRQICLNRHDKSAGSDISREKGVILWVAFLGCLFLIALLGIWLAYIGSLIAQYPQFNQNFVGVFFLALSTSLPEFAVSFSAFRRGAVDMAIGNIIGSNFFDVFIVPVMDMLHKGPLLASVDRVNLVTTLIPWVLTPCVLAGLFLLHKGNKNGWWVLWLSACICVLGVFVIYTHG